MLAWEQTCLREHSTWLLVDSLCDNRRMRLQLHEIEDLSVAVEKHDACLHHVLEDKVLVIVADLVNVAHHKVIESSLPLGSQFISLSIIVNFFLGDLSIQDLLIHASSQTRWDSTLRILDQERLVVFLE